MYLHWALPHQAAIYELYLPFLSCKFWLHGVQSAIATRALRWQLAGAFDERHTDDRGIAWVLVPRASIKWRGDSRGFSLNLGEWPRLSLGSRIWLSFGRNLPSVESVGWPSAWANFEVKAGQCKLQSGDASAKELEEARRIVEECLRPKSSVSAIVLVVTSSFPDFKRVVLDLLLIAIHVIFSFHVTEFIKVNWTKLLAKVRAISPWGRPVS